MKERLDALFAHFTSRSPTYLNTLPSLKTRAQLLKFSLLPLHLYLTRYDSSLQSKLFYGFLFLFETRSMRLFLLFYSLFFLSLSWAILKIRSSRVKFFILIKLEEERKYTYQFWISTPLSPQISYLNPSLLRDYYPPNHLSKRNRDTNRLSKPNNSPANSPREIFVKFWIFSKRKKIATRQSRRSCCSRTFRTLARNKAGESINWRTLVPALIIPVEGWPRVICYLHIIRGAALRGPTGRN